MKLTITKSEVAALIRSKFNLPPDAIIEIVENKDSCGQDDEDWIINTQTVPFPPYTLDVHELLDVVYNNGDDYFKCDAVRWARDWDTNNNIHIVKYRKHRG